MTTHHPNHPASCTNPDCTLSYRDHLLSISIAPSALITRAPEASQTNTRDQRWQDDMDAFKRLHKEGLTPPQQDGARFREQNAETPSDITHRPVDINYEKHGGDSWHTEARKPTPTGAPSLPQIQAK